MVADLRGTRHEVVRVGISLAAGLILLLLLGIVLYGMNVGLMQEASPVAIGSAPTKSGTGPERPPVLLEIAHSGEAAGVNLPLSKPIDARRFHRAVLILDEPRPGYRFAFGWVSATGPRVTRLVPLAPVTETRREVDLRDHPDWTNAIRGAAFFMTGPSGPPVMVTYAALEPVQAGLPAIYRAVFMDWLTFEGWSGYSINFIRGGRVGAPVSPVVAVALWVFLSTGVYALWSAAGRRRLVGGSLVFLFMAGWVTLDLRWQVDLVRQLEITRDQYSGKTWEEKRLSAADGELFAWVQHVKDHLGDETRRVFVVAERDYSYPALRAKYHLLPHNADHQLPRLEHLRPGDYLMLLSGSDDRLQLRTVGVRGSGETGVMDEGGLLFTADRLDGLGSQLMTDPDAPGGYARAQHRPGGDLITARTPESLPPGYYNLRFVLASPESPGTALIRVGTYDGESDRPEEWFMRRVTVNPGGYIGMDLGVVLPDAGRLAVSVARASPGLLSAGFEISLLEWRTEPLLASSRNLQRLVEPVLQSRAGTLYRVR